MKHLFTILLLASAMTVTTARTQDADEPKTDKVTKLDGTSLFGLVTVTDDYTLKISNDTGIFNVPLAVLGETDFKKYALQKDRSKDGRLWSERKTALEDEQKDPEENDPEKASTNNSAIEIQLAEISAFQPLISAYEATLGPAESPQSKKSDPNSNTDASDADEPGRRLFSGPGTAGALPFSGPGSSVVQPVMSAAGSVIQSAAGVTGLPTVPSTDSAKP